MKITISKVLRPFEKFLQDNNYDPKDQVFMQGTF